MLDATEHIYCLPCNPIILKVIEAEMHWILNAFSKSDVVLFCHFCGSS